MSSPSAPIQDPGAPRSPPLPQSSLESSTASPSLWGRHLRQFGLMFAGAGFMAASIAVSRRAVLRKQVESFPKFYISNRNASKMYTGDDKSMLAVQAFGLATLNVTSFAIFLTGGLSWAFDLSSVVELRQRTKAALSKPGLVNPEDEKELEAMMDSLLARLGMDKPETSDEGSGQEKKSDGS